MKYLLVVVLFLSTSTAADLTGRWVAESQGRQTVFMLKSNGGKLEGYLASQQGNDLRVADGKVSRQRRFPSSPSSAISTGRIAGRSTPPRSPPKASPSLRQEGRKRTRSAPDARQASLHRSSQARFRAPGRRPPCLAPTTTVPSNGLAQTPPMGWNSWNKFQRRVSDQMVREIAAAMVKNGMKDAGYLYVNIDDTWQGTRDARGNIRANEKFPDMKALADYVHSLGLKIGIYSSPGPLTCAGFEGSFQHEEQDAKTYAAWGIDYLKYDGCSAARVYEMSSMPAVYAKMGQALANSGRPIVYSLCQYGLLNVGEWGTKAGGNLWRTTRDIRDAWASMTDYGFDQQGGLEKYAGPGHWNDPDMLEIGNGHVDLDEYRVHMSLWSILASPLIAGNMTCAICQPPTSPPSDQQ